VHSNHTFRRIALLAVFALAALCFTSAASALDSDPGGDGDPNLPPDRPNLVVSAASVTHGTIVNDWIISYTVANKGTAPAGAFRVSVVQDGTGLIKETPHAALAAGASRSETIHILRTNCYIAVRFTADSTRVVTESKETDNVRSAIDLTSLTCPTQPKYTVKAVSFHANDESGIDALGSDEPYVNWHGVGVPGTEHSTASHVFGDIDTGDTAFFGPAEGCMYISCSGGPAPLGMGFSVELWEHDVGYIPGILSDAEEAFRDVGGILQDGGDPMWLGTASTLMGDAIGKLKVFCLDDLLGSQTYTYSPVLLASKLPAVGGSFSDTRSYVDDGILGSNYTITTVVTRVG
jgi:hypothetical protein